MVAISLYRGNLHRVPDVPRRWFMPTHQISLKDFKSLLHRRSKALSRLHSSTAITTTTSSNPNPSSDPNQQIEAPKENASPVEPQLEPQNVVADSAEGPSGEVKDQRGSDGGDLSVKPVDASDQLPEHKAEVLEKASDAKPENPNSEVSNKSDVLNEKEKRKREVEEKLKSLNEKKHNLVLVLKQILNAEEELKRRNSVQGMGVRPLVPLQVDVTNDTGLMIRHVGPRMGSEGNLGGDMEVGETDDLSNLNIHSRHVLRTSSMSPSSESPLRRPAFNQHNMVSHPSRASFGATGSPSRFAPTGHQGNPLNVPAVSVSGTNYIASSPSPAASGGTSVFRDARLPSPWN